MSMKKSHYILPVLLGLICPLFISAREEKASSDITVFLEFHEGRGADGQIPFETEEPRSVKLSLYFPDNFDRVAVSSVPVFIYPLGWTDRKQELRIGRNTVSVPEELINQNINLVVLCGGRFAGMILFTGTPVEKKMTIEKFESVPGTGPKKAQGSLKEITGTEEADEYVDREDQELEEETGFVDYEVPVSEGSRLKRVYWHFMAGFGNVTWPGYIEDEIDVTESLFADLDERSVSIEFDIGVYWKLTGMENSFLGLTLFSGKSEFYSNNAYSEEFYVYYDHGPAAVSWQQFFGGKPAGGWFLRCDLSFWGSIVYQNEFDSDTYHRETGIGWLIGTGYSVDFGGDPRMTYEIHISGVQTSEGNVRGVTFGIGALF